MARRSFNDMVDKAYRSGFLAGRAGHSIDANPYSGSDLRRLEWRKGWLAADLDAEETAAHTKITDEMR